MLSKPVLILLGLVVVGSIGAGVILAKDNDAAKTSIPESAMEEKAADAMMEEEATDDDTMMKEEATELVSDRYVPFSESTFAANVSKRRVYFFHASWCPTCKVSNTAFEANADGLPEDVVVLKTDYDTEIALKKKFGVTYQHTFVQVDENGEQVAKWNGGDVEELVQNII